MQLTFDPLPYIDWKKVCKFEQLTEEFIVEHQKLLKWPSICAYQNLSEPFMRSFHNKLSWDHVALNQILSEDFIEEYMSKLNMYSVLSHQKLSEIFLRKHKKTWDDNPSFWRQISDSQVLSESFIEEFESNLITNSIYANQTLSEDFLRKRKSSFGKHDWHIISTYQNLSEDFIEEFEKQLNWLDICSYQTLSEDFMEKHYGKINLDAITKFQNLSNDFIEKHLTDFKLENLCKYQSMSDDLIRKCNLSKDLWYALSTHNQLSPEIKSEYSHFMCKVKPKTLEQKIKEIKAYVKTCNLKYENDYLYAYALIYYPPSGFKRFNKFPFYETKNCIEVKTSSYSQAGPTSGLVIGLNQKGNKKVALVRVKSEDWGTRASWSVTALVRKFEVV